MAQPKTWVKVAVALGIPVVFFGLLELGLRLFGYRYARGAERVAYEKMVHPERLYAPDPDLIWTLPRSTVMDEWDSGYLNVRTNSMGLRGPEAPADKAPNELRVLCLGDSATFGLGVPEGETWPEHLARILGASPALAGRPLHVLNGGVPGWSSVQGMRLYEKLDWYDPDVVVFWFGMNDVQAARGQTDAQFSGGVLAEAAGLLYGLRCFQLVAEAVDEYRDVSRMPRASTEEYRSAVEALQRDAAAKGFQAIFVRQPERIAVKIVQFERILARAEEENVDQLAGPLPTLSVLLPAPPGSDLTGRVVEGLEGRELRFAPVVEMRRSLEDVRIDLADARMWKERLEERFAELPSDAITWKEMFDSASAPPHVLFTDNCHPSPVGNRYAAEAVARRILANLPPR